MNTKPHDRAHALIAASSVEGVTPPDASWLQDHLVACTECARYAEASTLSRQALHSLSFRVSPALVAATQARVRMRAEELRERDQRLIPVVISCVLAFAIGVMTTPLMWQAFAWIGGVIHLPALLWQTGFVLTWFAPAILATVLLLMFRGHRPETAAD